MGLNGKYGLGTVLTFVLSVSVVPYGFPLTDTIMETQGSNPGTIFSTRLVIWMVVLLIIRIFYKRPTGRQKFFSGKSSGILSVLTLVPS